MRCLALSLALSLAACGSSSSTPGGTNAPDDAEGEAVDAALGVPMPEGTRQLRVLSGAGHEGASEQKVVLATTMDVAAARAHFAALPDATPGARACMNVNGSTVCVTPPDEIPNTLFAPVRPALPSAPRWANAWISVSRSTPLPCPPCPEGFTGTLVPSCTCP